MSVVWGASGFYHDAAISVLNNGLPVFASSSERYSRIKNDPNICKDLVDACLEFGTPDRIIWYESPIKRALRGLLIDKRIVYNSPSHLFKRFGISAPIKTISHHDAHLNACLFTAPFTTDNTLGVIVDSVGEFSSTSFWNINYKAKSRLSTNFYPNSLGLFYSSITQLLGLKPQEEEYIMMGMAAYGSSDDYYHILKKIFFDKSYNLKVDLRRGCRGLFSKQVVEKNQYDIARGAQKLYEEIFIELCKTNLHAARANKIILGGGCALNCVANTKLFELVDAVWVFPNPGDAGASLGAALSDKKEFIELKNMFLGHNIGSLKSPQSVVDLLLSNKVAGVMHGKAEFGPRALGNRSILADPRLHDIKDVVNDIKGRERFRPFAPIVLEEHAHKLFNMPCHNSPYMSFVFTSKCADDLPGLAHVDASARIQTVNKNSGCIHKILTLWYEQTGCPALINTSLNMKGYPLLNRMEDVFEFKDNPLNIVTPEGIVQSGRIV